MSDMINFFYQGGLAMYPIALAFFIGLALVIERWRFLQSFHNAQQKSLNELLPLCERRDFQAIAQRSQLSDVVTDRIFHRCLKSVARSQNREDLHDITNETIADALPSITQRTAMIATLANIATLMGLLGTVMGLIAAFTAIGAAEGGSKADLLSSSISVAMNTTAFGLICAIPLLIAHTFLMSKTQKVVGLLEVASLKSVNAFAPLLNKKANSNESVNLSSLEQA